MISQVWRDTGLVPLLAASLDEFRVTIPRTSLVTEEIRVWARLLGHGQDLSEAQFAILALARAGHSVSVTSLHRMGLSPSDARRQLNQLQELGFLQPRRARADGSYRLAPGWPRHLSGTCPRHPPGMASRSAYSKCSVELTLPVAKSFKKQRGVAGAVSSMRWKP